MHGNTEKFLMEHTFISEIIDYICIVNPKTQRLWQKGEYQA